jgi:hypothetical protein
MNLANLEVRTTISQAKKLIIIFIFFDKTWYLDQYLHGQTNFYYP